MGEILGCNGKYVARSVGIYLDTMDFFTNDMGIFYTWYNGVILVGHTPQHGHLLGIATKIYGAGHGKILYCLVWKTIYFWEACHFERFSFVHTCCGHMWFKFDRVLFFFFCVLLQNSICGRKIQTEGPPVTSCVCTFFLKLDNTIHVGAPFSN